MNRNDRSAALREAIRSGWHCQPPNPWLSIVDRGPSRDAALRAEAPLILLDSRVGAGATLRPATSFGGSVEPGSILIVPLVS